MKKLVLLIVIIPILLSCDDFLNVEQVDIIYNEVYWKNESDAEKGVNGIYALYRGLMVNPKNWYQRADATTGFIKGGWNGGSPGVLYQIGNFSDVNGVKSWGQLEDYADWSPFYKVVAMSNLVIAKVSTIPEAKFTGKNKDKLLGEAYFMRALVYFNILRLWGNAPYINESIESSTQLINNDLTPIVIGRTDDIEIGKKILEDLAIAIEKLEYGVPGSKGWGITANRGSAEALAGHVNMWMYFLANRDNLNAHVYLTNAISALENVTRFGGYSLVDYSASDAIKTLYQGKSSEAVFELNISTDNNESYRADKGGIISLTCKFQSLDNDANKDRASAINFVPFAQKQLIYPEYDIDLKTGDIRANLFFDAWESTYDEPFSDVSATSTDRNMVTWMKKYALMSLDALHSWDENLPYFAEANIPILRYTDIYLLLAEAYCKDNKPDKALDIVNNIRLRAGLNKYSGGNLLNEVLQQRVSELIGEGQIYFDMVRNNHFPNPQVMDPSRYQQEGYYWPVSGQILSANKLVHQTPYWNGKTIW